MAQEQHTNEMKFIDPPVDCSVDEPVCEEPPSIFKRFKDNIDRLQLAMELPMVRKLGLSSINSKLEDMIRQCDAIQSLEQDETLPSAEQFRDDLTYIAPTKKLDLQWRPNKMVKTRKTARRKPGALTSPTWEERAAIKTELVDDSHDYSPLEKSNDSSKQNLDNIEPPAKKNFNSKLQKKAPKTTKITITDNDTAITEVTQVQTTTSKSLTEKLLHNDCYAVCLLDLYMQK